MLSGGLIACLFVFLIFSDNYYMIKKFTLLLLAVAAATFQSFAQGFCGSDIIAKRIKAQHPELAAAYEAQLEEDMKPLLHRARSMARRTADTGVYEIPVVVHIMHDYGAENLSDTFIYNTIDAWNRTMMKLNADTALVIEPFKKHIGNPRIRFHLATKDPNGNPTKGITRHHSWHTNSISEFTKAGGWPRDEYVNVWVVRSIGGYLAGAAAYAYYPINAAIIPYYDGILTTAYYFNYANTVPHEFGHTFNLKHTFDNAATVGQVCGDDDVPDTPPTKGHYSTGCVPSALLDTACATGYVWIYKDINGLDSVVDYPDTVNAENVMDYTYCSRMFTNGQAARMRASLTSNVSGRSNLHSQGNLDKTGALAPMLDMFPVADFSVDRTTAGGGLFTCIGNNNSVIFRNASWNDTITNVAWTFSNGATLPASTSMTSVSNKFTQPGWVSVTLTATGNNTGSNTITNSQALYVADDATVRPEGYWQTFDNIADTMQWPIFNYFNNQFKWERYDGAGYDGNTSLRYHSFDNRPFPENMTGRAESDFDDVITPAFDLTGVTSDLNLNFYTAGAYKRQADSLYRNNIYKEIVDSTASDSLKVYLSSSCGTFWREIATIKGTDLLNNPLQNTEFIPASQNQWRAQTVNIPAAVRSGKVFFRFRYFPANNSNNLYLDRFTITPFPTDVQEVMSRPNTIKIFPNPTHGVCKVAFTATGNGMVNYGVRDITGRILYSEENVYPVNTLVQHELPSYIFGTPGIYLVTVTIANKTTTQKVVVQ